MTVEQIAELCHEANVLIPSSSGLTFEHENWLKEKAADGWKYGAIKDPDKKEHPCFIPYGELPIEQRTKDSLFISVVNSFRHLVG